MMEQITRVRSLDERYKRLEEKELQLKMKESLSEIDSQRLSEIIAEKRDIERKIAWLDLQS